MTPKHRRMMDPAFYTDPRLDSIELMTLYPGIFTLAEDSGCLVWDERIIRAELFPLIDNVTSAAVAAMMKSLEECGLVRVYTVEDRRHAWLTEWPVWQRSLTRLSAPASVPLPEWIVYVPHTDPNRSGSGSYFFDDGRSLPQGAANRTSESTESNQSNELKKAGAQPGDQPGGQAAKDAYEKAGY